MFIYSFFLTVFESLMETALEENRRMNTDRADAMLLRAYNMYRHPLLLAIQEEGLASQSVPIDGAAIDALAIPAAFKGKNRCKL